MVLQPWLLYQITPSLTMRKKIFFVESSAISYCPICGEPLAYRDSCQRIMLLEGRERRIYIIRRLKCHQCGRLHRQLPDCLAPFKHYATEVISGVLDGIVTPEDDDSADYPCGVTMYRWHHWLMVNHLRIDGYLKSVGYRLLGFGEELAALSDTFWNEERLRNYSKMKKVDACTVVTALKILADKKCIG